MSTFAVKVRRIKAIEPIPNADAIELAVVDDYRSVVRKGDFQEGSLAVYIPEASVVPLPLLQAMGLEGKLAGSEKNRVKAVKLRGCLSQGILYNLVGLNNSILLAVPPEGTLHSVAEQDDVTNLLGIVKWEPPIPAYMSGEVYNAGQDLTVSFDVENIKAYPEVFQEGEEVLMTEKLHGTFCGVGIMPYENCEEKHVEEVFVVFSKGLGAKGLCFKDTEKNRGNVYFRALEKSGVFKALRLIREDMDMPKYPIFLLGEVYGKGVQDLAYGSNEVAFRAFDMVVGYRGDQRFIDYDSFLFDCNWTHVDTVPLVYRGPYSKEVMLQHTSGLETVSGKSMNMREGVVIRPVVERQYSELGRVILKSVSEEYLLRKGATEFN